MLTRLLSLNVATKAVLTALQITLFLLNLARQAIHMLVMPVCIVSIGKRLEGYYELKSRLVEVYYAVYAVCLFAKTVT